MRNWIILALCCLALALSVGAFAADPELVKLAQKELIALGYEPGNIQGQVDTETTVAVSKFQAENNMDVTGEVTPQLVGVLRAARNKGTQSGARSASTSATIPVQQQQPQSTLQQRQQECLQEKYAAAQERQKKKRGVMRLLSAVSRTSQQFGDGKLAETIDTTASNVYDVNATAEDLSAAAEDLGLTEEEVEECRNPK